MQLINDALRLLAERIKDAEHRLQSAVNGHVKLRILARQRSETLLLLCRKRRALVLEDEVVAADDGLLAVHQTGNAVGYHVLHLGMHLRMLDASLLGLMHHRVCDGMREMLLQAGSQLQCLRLVYAVEGLDPHHLRCRMGQRTGLIKDNGIGLGHGLQELAALYGNVGLAGFSDRRQHRQRHGQLQGTGEIHHQEGNRPGHVPRQEIGERRARQGIGHQAVRQMKGLGLRVGLQLLGILDHPHDLVVLAGAGSLADEDHALALLHNGAGINITALRLHHRHGFTGHGGLVHTHLTGNHHTVQRDNVGGPHNDAVPGLYGAHVHEHILALSLEPYLIHLQRHGTGQIADRLLVGPLLQDLADVQQEHDGGRRCEVTSQHGGQNCRGIQHRHLDPSVQQAA